jgi:DNA (cytosine-5)-methyltransferase 1
MKNELMSEKLAKNICEMGMNETVLKLVENKVKLYTEKKNEKVGEITYRVSKEGKLVEREDWRNKQFSNPNAEVKIATLFSGIGAAEYALRRLNLKHKVVFAGDIDPHVKRSYKENFGVSRF